VFDVYVLHDILCNLPWFLVVNTCRHRLKGLLLLPLQQVLPNTAFENFHCQWQLHDARQNHEVIALQVFHALL
jgi:hypothetical protein